MSVTYRYARAALTVDVVLFGWDGARLQLLLIQRANPPFAGQWALPGGFVDLDETLDQAAARELAEETGVADVYLEQLFTFGAVERDPRERVVSVAYFALVDLQSHVPAAASDASDARWFTLDALPSLAFDHADILAVAMARLRSKVRWQPVGFELLPAQFTLSQLQDLYEAILGRGLDKRNFRRRLDRLGVLQALDETRREGAHRPARLYRFDPDRYAQLVRDGGDFQL